METCKICKSVFTKSRMGQVVCGYECAQALAVVQREKAEKVAKVKERREDSAKCEKLKRRADWLREVQTIVNQVVRERDKDQPCISCGRYHQGQWHAGHYLSTGAHPEKRFNLKNIHKQCQPCNTHLSGNQLEYRKGLIARYGQDYVDSIELPEPTRKYQVSDLINLKSFFKDKLKAMKEND